MLRNFVISHGALGPLLSLIQPGINVCMSELMEKGFANSLTCNVGVNRIPRVFHLSRSERRNMRPWEQGYMGHQYHTEDVILETSSHLYPAV